MGSLLLAGAATAGMSVAIIPVLLLLEIDSSGGGRSGSPQMVAVLMRAWLLAAVITVSGWATGLYLLRGRRGTVLWLRRFGFDDAIRVVTVAVRYLGRSWRIVTLDDARATAVGVGASVRTAITSASILRRAFGRAVRLGELLGRPVAVVCGLGIVVVLAVSGYQGRFEEVVSPLFGSEWPVVESTESFLLLLFVAVFVLVVLIFVAAFAVWIACLPLLGLSVASNAISESAQDAEAAKSRLVGSALEAELAGRAIADIGRRIIAPRLTVLTVETPWWRDAVREVAKHSSAAVVDVSQPTDNVVWEIEELEHLSVPWVAIGHRPEMLEMSIRCDDAAGRLRELLEGRHVLTYTTGALGRLRFERALFDEVESAVPRRALSWLAIVRTLVVAVGVASFVLAIRGTILLVTGG